MKSIQYDSLLLKKGKAFLSGKWQEVDLLLEKGKISALTPAGSGSKADRQIDLAGLYISPGWVDLHAHLYPLRKGGIGKHERKIGLATGVTALLDVGTVGAANFEDYKKFVLDRSAARVFVLLNIKSKGIRFWGLGRVKTGEDDLDLICKVAAKYPEVIKGIKCTASKEHMAADDPMYYPLRALEAGKRCNLPVMIHFGVRPPDLEELLPLLRKGDILTHVFRNGDHHILTEGGKIRPSVLEARKRGVVFDIGHGVKSFSFPVCEAALAQGFDDFTISSDLYMLSTPYRAKRFANVLGKFLAVGMKLEDVMDRASRRPGQWLGLEREIAADKPAELTVFGVREGSFKLKDCWDVARTGKQRIEPAYAISGGKIFEAGRPLPF